MRLHKDIFRSQYILFTLKCAFLHDPKNELALCADTTATTTRTTRAAANNRVKKAKRCTGDQLSLQLN